MFTASSGTLYDVFRLFEIRSKQYYKFESVAAMGDIVFIGSGDGNIVVFRVARADGMYTPASCLTLCLQTTKGKNPIKQMAAIQERGILVVLTGGKLQVHSVKALDSTSKGGGGGDMVPEIGSLRGATDVTAFHIKKEGGKFFLAAIHQKKKVTVYQLSDTVVQGDLMFTEVRAGLALPEVAVTVAWSGPSLLLGFKKEFVLMNTVTGSTSGLFTVNTDKPMAANMDPLHELIIGTDTTGVRIALDGAPCANAGLAWASQPTAIAYYHPYVLSIHDGNSIEVRNPFLQGSGGQLCQTLSMKYGDRLSSRGYVDLDLPKPSNKIKFDPSVIRRDVLVGTTGNSSVFVLDFVPLQQQALHLAQQRLFDASLDLCQICPNEVPSALVNELRVMHAMHNFSQKNYSDAFQKFRESDVDPRSVISLFPGFMPVYAAYKTQKNKPVLDANELESTIREAVSALVDYLQPRRRPPSADEMAVLISLPPPTEEAEMIQACIDTALMRAYVQLRQEVELTAMLQNPNYCVVEDTEVHLKENKQFLALVAFWKARGRHSDALTLLHTLGVCGTATPMSEHRPTLQTQQKVINAVDEILDESDGIPHAPWTQSEIRDRFDSSGAIRDVPEKEKGKIFRQICGVIGTLHCLRSLNTQQDDQKVLFATYCGWILANIEPRFSLTIFVESVTPPHHTDAVRLLAAIRDPGGVSATKRTAEYLERVMGKNPNRIDDPYLHDERVKALIELTMEERRPSDTTIPFSQKQLLAFLKLSTTYTAAKAIQWLSTGDYAKSFSKERAVVYRRMKLHKQAIEMFLNEIHSTADAKAYASSVANEDPTAFRVLLEFLLAKAKGEDSKDRTKEALDVINSCEGVDARTALPLLPETTKLSAIKDFLMSSLRASQSRTRTTEVYSNVLKTRLLQCRVEAAHVKAKHALIEGDTTCAYCKKKVRADTVFARYPNGVVVHQACVDDEHVCPQTFRDFRNGVETILQ